MSQKNHLIKSKHVPFLLSVPALGLWIGVMAYLLKWVRAAAAGRLEPGAESTWIGLYGIFTVAVIALAAGIFLTIRAWQGKSTMKWQLLSIILGLLFLWATSGD